MKVYDLMCDHVISVGADEPVTAAARILKQQNIGALPVCGKDGRLQGIVTDRDIVLRCVAPAADPDTLTVRDVMTRGVVTVSPYDDIAAAARLMASSQVRRLPVCQDGAVVGMLALGDLAQNGSCDMEAANALSDISSNIRRR
ncbi:MAG TPA: CBS domain-containing protein [Oscillospiraceae bacterium]|nr:CBS domain-containing protein [Oscillospiraceae bacterium]HPS76345.1 CBS domain-containing protein [Oscillospiraceae bacterium]